MTEHKYPPTSDMCVDCDTHLSEFCWVCHGRMEKQRDDARIERDRLRAEADTMRNRIAVLREALEDIREWAQQDDVLAFEDGDIPLADFCDRVLKGEK